MKPQLKKLISSLNLTQKDFASSLGLKASIISDVLHGRAKGFSNEILLLLLKKYNVSIDWLLTGEGEMFIDGEPRTDKLPDDEKELLTDYRQLPIKEKCEVASFTKFKLSEIKSCDKTYRMEDERIHLPPMSANVLKKPALKMNGSSYSYLHVNALAEKENLLKDGTLMVPLLGTIAAGLPILACENVEKHIPFPAGVIPSARRAFALRVRGDSMIGAFINSGDIAILTEVISPKDEVRSGGICAVLIGQDATLKQVFFDNGGFILKAANDKYDDIVCTEPDCRIIGRLVTVLRDMD